MINSKLGLANKLGYVDNPIINYVQHTLADTSKCKDNLKLEAKFALGEGLAK
jgi:hypothetical protein